MTKILQSFMLSFVLLFGVSHIPSEASIRTLVQAPMKLPAKATPVKSSNKVAAKKRTRHNATKTKLANNKSKNILRTKVAAIKKKPVIRLTETQRKFLQTSFSSGDAGRYSASQLVAAGVFTSYPLRGGVFQRRNPVKTIVIHSTETASVASAKAIVRSWNNSGYNHPGTQFIVDRDGTIYQTVDPIYATFHVDSSRTRESVNNDSSIGIEIVRTGSQQYTQTQLSSVTHLVHYLKEHFSVQQIVGHGQIQPSDRSDPVGFDWLAFQTNMKLLGATQVALRKTGTKAG